MPSDASIYSMIRPQERQPGPMDQLGVMMQLRAMGDASQLHGLQRQKLESDMAEEAAFKSKIADWASGGGQGALSPDAWAASPTRAAALEKTRLEGEKSRTEISAKKMETLAKGMSIIKDQLPTVRDDATYSALVETANRVLGPDMVKQANLPPAFDPEWVKRMVVKSDEMFTPKPQVIERPDGSKVTVDMNPWTNPRIVGTEYAAGMTPAQSGTAAHQAATLAETQRHHQVTEANAAATAGVPAGYRKTADGKLEPIPGGPADQPTATQKDELTSIARTQQQATRLKAMFTPEYVGFRGSWGEFLDKYGSQVIPGVDGDQGRIQFRALAADLENQYIKAISGATVPTSEVPRLRRAIPTASDSPAQYKAKLEEMEKNLTDLPNIIRNGSKASGAPSPDAPKPVQPKTFDAMPDPAQYKGKRLDGDDGVSYRSDGKRWVRISG